MNDGSEVTRRKRMLVAYSAASAHTQTTIEYLRSLKAYSDFDVVYVHVTHEAVIDFDINEFDVVFLNYCARLCIHNYVSSSFRTELKRFLGLKIASVQDDYDNTSLLHSQLREHGVHVLITCIQPEFWPLVYPEAELPGVTIVQGLTGYLPESLIHGGEDVRPLSERNKVIVYRGGYISAKYGRLAYEKNEIGRRMKEVCVERGISHDISTDVDDRLYGTDWYNFLASGRVALGAETGSNAFDFDGSVSRKFYSMADELGRHPTFAEFADNTGQIESYFNVGQISPRAFECACLRTPMLLFRGSYSGILVPDVDYICLEKDFSNLENVLERLNDLTYLETIASNAYQTLVGAGKYDYRAFARLVVAAVDAGHQKYISEERVAFMRTVSENWEVYSNWSHEQLGMSKSELAVLKERPTEFPKAKEEFEQGLFALSIARQQQAKMRPREDRRVPDIVVRNPALWRVRTMTSKSFRTAVIFIWKLLPAAVKISIRRALRRAAGV